MGAAEKEVGDTDEPACLIFSVDGKEGRIWQGHATTSCQNQQCEHT